MISHHSGHKEGKLVWGGHSKECVDTKRNLGTLASLLTDFSVLGRNQEVLGSPTVSLGEKGRLLGVRELHPSSSSL